MLADTAQYSLPSEGEGVVFVRNDLPLVKLYQLMDRIQGKLVKVLNLHARETLSKHTFS